MKKFYERKFWKFKTTNVMKTLNMENLGLAELSSDSIRELSGGGWIADFTEWFVSSLKCGCKGMAMDGGPYAVGRVL